VRPSIRQLTSRQISLAFILVAVLVGCALRAWQYLADTSLWLDEIALVRGILDRDVRSLLLVPMPYGQVAPKAFLLAQKLAVLALGPSDRTLRLFPFLCSSIGMLAFAAVARRVLGDVEAAVATILFAFAAPLIVFAGNVKQYSTDVAVAVLLLWIAVDLTDRPVPRRRAVVAGLLGAGLVWFSQAGVLVVVAFALVLPFWQRRLALVLVPWGASALAVTLVGLASMSPSTRDYLHRFWASGFPPVPLARAVATGWPWERIRVFLGAEPHAQVALSYPAPPLYAALALVGGIALWREQRRLATLVASPFLVALGAAVIRQYPFSDRLILFLAPFLFIAMAVAVGAVHRTINRYSSKLGAVAVCALVLPAVYPVLAAPPAYRVEDVKSVLSRIAPRKQPGDLFYIYYGAAPATTFYAESFGITHADYRVGGCHRGNSKRYLEELDSFRGRSRVWVILTHAVPLYRERDDILGYLDAIGSRKYGIVVPSYAVGRKPLPAEGYLYDLRETPSRLGATAASFHLTGPSAADPALACADGPQSMIPADFPY